MNKLKVVKIYQQYEEEYNIICTDAGIKEIEKQLNIINNMLEEGIEVKEPYEYLRLKGYVVDVLSEVVDGGTVEWGIDYELDLANY